MTVNPLNYRPSRSAAYYTPPRRIDSRRAAVSFIVGALAAAVGGVAYALIQRQLEHVLLRIGEAIAGALAIGAIASATVAYARVRVPLLASGIGALLALIALYAMWIAWVHACFPAGLGLTYPWLVRHPISVSRLIRLLNQLGTWKYQDELVRGPALWIIWILEITPMLLCGVLFPLKAMPGDVPCLTCGTECKLVRPIARFAIECRDELLSRAEARDFAHLANLPPPPFETAAQLSLRLMSCPRCGQTNLLTVNHLSYTTHKNGLQTLNVRPLIDQLMIPPTEAAGFRDAVKRMLEVREAEKTEAS